MARVLCAWELGGGLGHIRPLAALAHALRDAGHEPALALGDLAHANAIVAPFAWYQAPLMRIATNPNPSPLSAPDVLAQMGFADSDQVVQVLRAWLALFALEKTDVVVGDYAPAAMLAARMAGLPRVSFGNGYSSPKRGDPMPAFRTWLACDPAELARIDAVLLAAVNRALESLGARPLEKASELFDADLDLVGTFAPLDPFGPRERGEHLGPLDASAGGVDARWAGDARPRILAYLKPDYAHFRAALTALAAMPGEALVAAPGLAAADAAVLSSARMRVIPASVDLSAVLDTADVVIGHGGAGFTASTLMAGKPQGLLPMQLEQALTARRAAALGVASVVEDPSQAPDLPAWLRELAQNAQRRDAALRAAAAVAGHSPREAAARAAARVASVAKR